MGPRQFENTRSYALAELLRRVDEGKYSIAEAAIAFEAVLEGFSLDDTVDNWPDKTLLAGGLAMSGLLRYVGEGKYSIAEAKTAFEAMEEDFSLLGDAVKKNDFQENGTEALAE